MRSALAALLLVSASALAQNAQPVLTDGPTDARARKLFDEARTYLHQHGHEIFAVDGFRKAYKQDSYRCGACAREGTQSALDIGDIKTSIAIAEDWVAHAQLPKEQAEAHYRLGVAYLAQARRFKKPEAASRSDQELQRAIALDPVSPDPIFADGIALSYLEKDEAARSRFQQYVKFTLAGSAARQRVQRFINRPELARARMAPSFAIATTDGRKLTLDDLTGKVVLIDFWATWCGPCREALPHIQSIARKFSDQPLVVLSISLDKDEQKWRNFVAKNQMTWLQYRDDGFDGSVARLFSVESIPHTFTIDADGVLQDEHIGDGAIEGKLKKLLAQAREEKNRQVTAASVAPATSPAASPAQ